MGRVPAPLSILDALDKAQLFPGFDAPSWQPWRTALAAMFGLPLPDVGLYQRCTGRTTPPTVPAHEAWFVVGRRGGKSRVAAAVAVYLGAMIDYRPRLAPGEVATLAIVVGDREQAGNVLRHVRGLLQASPVLQRLVVSNLDAGDSVTLATGCRIAVMTCSFRSIRGCTLAGAILDECAYWMAEDSKNPDAEVVNALTPGLATLGGPIIGISSPYSRKGILWDAYRRHYGDGGAPDVLVWQADSRTMNPALSEVYVALSCYLAFCDPSGGSSDSMTLAVAHRTRDGLCVLDAVREARPPFSPDGVWAYLEGFFRRQPLARDEQLESAVERTMTMLQEDRRLVRTFFEHPAVA